MVRYDRERIRGYRAAGLVLFFLGWWWWRCDVIDSRAGV